MSLLVEFEEGVYNITDIPSLSGIVSYTNQLLDTNGSTSEICRESASNTLYKAHCMHTYFEGSLDRRSSLPLPCTMSWRRTGGESMGKITKKTNRIIM